MWNPTHVQVIVQRAKDLLIKGKGGTNDSYVVVQVGKERYMTSIKSKSISPVWYEECDLLFADKSQQIEIIVYHRNFFGIDEFLGQITIPLENFDICGAPQTKWYMLQGKKEKKSSKYRGQLEITVSFIVSDINRTGSSSTLYEKEKKSTKFKQLMSRAGQIKLPHMPKRSFSLKADNLILSQQLQQLRQKRLSDVQRRKSSSDEDAEQENNEMKSPTEEKLCDIAQSAIVQEEENSYLKEMPKRIQRTCSMPGSSFDKPINIYSKQAGHHLSTPPDNWKELIVNNSTEVHPANSDSSLLDDIKMPTESSSELKPIERKKKGKLRLFKYCNRRHSVQIPTQQEYQSSTQSFDSNGWLDGVSDTDSDIDAIPKEDLTVYKKMNRKQLIDLVVTQQVLLSRQKDKIKDMEDYIDDLLLRVMETSPRILHIAFKTSSLEYVR